MRLFHLKYNFASIFICNHRLDNIVFNPLTLEVAAVLDWELSTIGDPITDLVSNCITVSVEVTCLWNHVKQWGMGHSELVISESCRINKLWLAEIITPLLISYVHAPVKTNTCLGNCILYQCSLIKKQHLTCNNYIILALSQTVFRCFKGEKMWTNKNEWCNYQ